LSISDQSGRVYDLKAIDELLQNGAFTGIKTGYTVAAGQCFVGLTSIAGHPVITVLLNSPDRFGETQALADWIGKTYTWQ
jgi:D-alanyl-D-alanine carboxypeptidase